MGKLFLECCMRVERINDNFIYGELCFYKGLQSLVASFKSTLIGISQEQNSLRLNQRDIFEAYGDCI